jgi:hypothetical protein
MGKTNAPPAQQIFEALIAIVVVSAWAIRRKMVT